jgi:beta-lactamase regulating signal transducer with metallopeptidase domain
MNAIINNCITALNNIGRGFCNYSAGVFVQSALLIILLLLIDFMLRKRVRATFRYWMWILVFIKLILPPTLSLPTGIGYWCGDFLSSDSSIFRQASIIAQQESFEIPAIQVFSESSDVPAINESMDSYEMTISQHSTESAQVPQISPSQTRLETTVPAVPKNPILNTISWQAAVFLIWLIGVLVITLLLIQRMLFVKGLIARSEPSDERLTEIINQCRRQLGIGRHIKLRLSNNISSPAVCGLFKPILLMPTALDGKLPPEKLKAVFIHELVHIQRGDLWINLVQTVLQIIYFYNPLVWLVNAVVRSTREQAVDEKVLVVLGTEVKNYSNTLIDVAEMTFLRTSLSLRLIGVVESKRALNRRINIMLNRPIPKSAKLGVLGLVVIIIIGAILLPMAKGNWGRKGRIDELVKKLSSEDKAVWEPAAEQLKEIGPKVARQVAELFGTAPGDLHAIRVLESMATDEHVQDVMVQGLSAENSGVRHCSLIILSKSGKLGHVKRIIPLFRKDVENGEDHSMAEIALAELGGDDAYNALVETVTKDIPDQLRFMIAYHLAEMGRPEAAPHLKDALKLVNTSHPSAGARIVEAIHRLEDKNGVVEKPYNNGLYAFTLPEFNSKYSRSGYLYARDLQRANDAGMYVDKPPAEANAEEIISMGLRELAAGSKGDLIFERVGDQIRLQTYHGTLLAPLEVKVEPPHYSWADVVEEMNQSELKQLVLDYNNRHAKENAGSIPGFRLYPFDEGDLFAAALPSGQIAVLATKKIESDTSGVHLNVLYLDPLLALVGTERKETSQGSAADAAKWWRPDGNILDSDHVPSQSRMTLEPDEANNKASKAISKTVKVKSSESTESIKVDIAIDDRDLEVTKLSDRIFEAVIILRNKGSVPIPRFRVNFCAGDPDKGGRLLSAQAAGPIMPGDSWGEYNPGLKLRPDETVISVVVDPDNKVEESDETNNKASQVISMLASESERVDKVGAIQKLDLAGDDILLVEAQTTEGFNFPYYLFIPGGIDKDGQIYMLVETNNSGTVSDDLEFHRAKAQRLTERSHANRMARQLGVPLLVPTFPRPKTNWWAYTHALDIDTLEIEEGMLKRVDIQLTAMIKHAQELLRVNGFTIDDKIFMHGFSASAKFCNRYSYLHPEMVKAVAAGGVNGLPTLPVRQWNDCELPFPIGIAGIERFIDGSFNEEAFGQVAHYIYMGSLDRNDTLPSRDAWRQEEADIIKKALAEKMMPDRWQLTRKIYQQQKLPAQLVTYNGVTHAIKSQMLDDVINFFKANSEEKFVRIEPYEYPFVESKEIRPKQKSESTKIDIAIDDKNLTVTKQPNGFFKARIAIQNKGSSPLPRFKVIFYAGDPGKKGRKVYPGHHNAGPIMPRSTWNEGTLPFTLNEGETEIFVIVDPDNMVDELDETNNKVSTVIPGRQPKESVETIYKQTAQTEAKMTAKETEKAVKKVSGVDITPADFDIHLDEKRGVCNLVVSIQNKSTLTIPKFKLNFYRGDPSDNLSETGNLQTGSHGAGPIEPGKTWNEGTRAFHLPDGQYDFNVFLDFDNSISEIDENNNMALLQVRIENGRIVDKLVTCPSGPKGVPAESKVPAKMVGTWFFDNPKGDEEQMAVFPDGRVVVLYSNGHKDKTNIVDGSIELAEYNNAKCRMAVREDGILVQYFGRSESSGKRWRRISPVPHTDLLRSLSGSPEDKWKYFVTLLNGITVELVGVCDWPEEGKRCWRPDGSQLPMDIYASKWNLEPGVGQYGFIYKVTGPDDIQFSCRITGAGSTEGSCKVVDAQGNQIKNLTASISDMEEGRLSTTIRVGVAAGPWETIANHDGKRMKSGRQGGVLWSQAFQSYSGTHLVASREWRKDQVERVVAVDKDGKIYTTSHGSVASGKIDQLTASFRNLRLEQIEEFQYQVRPYHWVVFKDVSLRPGRKTDVQL